MKCYSSVVTERVLSFLQQNETIDEVFLQQLRDRANSQQRSEIEFLLDQRSDLVVTIAKLISQLTSLPYMSGKIQDVESVYFKGGKAFVKLISEDMFQAVLDPMLFPVEEKSSLVIIDQGFWDKLKLLCERVLVNEKGSFETFEQKFSEGINTEMWGLIDGDANEQLERILSSCIEMEASDIHIDLDVVDSKWVSRIRFRVDGECRDMITDPRKSIYEGIVSRLKALSFCRLDESRIPQDGRIPFVYKGETYEFRISFNPVTKKNEQLEKVVLRQMTDVNQCNLNMLGIHSYNIPLFREAIALPYGFNLVTGPTGSGKTTTLYSVLQESDRVAKNVCSIEEPIEAEIGRVNQTQVRYDIGLDFARILRALLRQDPDVIMVGEMRDLETAETALEAALTGHVVWSTLHTNSAVASITRLIQMGIKHYMAANALAFIFSQRLVQRVCIDCRKPHSEARKIIEEQIKPVFSGACDAVKVELEKALQNPQIYQATRNGNICSRCDGRGYRGRIGVMEVLKINDELRSMIISDPGNEVKMYGIAVDSGMMTMEQYCYLKILAGETTTDAVLEVVLKA